MKEKSGYLGAVRVSAKEGGGVAAAIKRVFVKSVKPTWREWQKDQRFPRHL